MTILEILVLILKKGLASQEFERKQLWQPLFSVLYIPEDDFVSLDYSLYSICTVSSQSSRVYEQSSIGAKRILCL